MASRVAPNASWGTLSSGVRAYHGPFFFCAGRLQGDISEALGMIETYRMAQPSNWNWRTGEGGSEQSTQS